MIGLTYSLIRYSSGGVPPDRLYCKQLLRDRHLSTCKIICTPHTAEVKNNSSHNYSVLKSKLEVLLGDCIANETLTSFSRISAYLNFLRMN